jgi:hypothetical protein
MNHQKRGRKLSKRSDMWSDLHLCGAVYHSIGGEGMSTLFRTYSAICRTAWI